MPAVSTRSDMEKWVWSRAEPGQVSWESLESQVQEGSEPKLSLEHACSRQA